MDKVQAVQDLLARFAWICAVAWGFALPASAAGVDCSKCHADLLKKKVVHAAIQQGCDDCHDQLDASVEPHKSNGKFPKGLSAEQPALCNDCHEKKMFQGKVVHAPVASGPCTECHDPHSSDYTALLNKEPVAVCFDCHSDIRKRPHVIVGFSGGGHPLGESTPPKVTADPLRPGKPFYCAACHEPHKSDRPKLNRFDKGMSSCQKCHKI